jgi:hypothetical protein
VIDSRARTRSIRPPPIVSVLAVGHGSQPIYRSHVLLDATEQLGFAVEATIRSIDAICLGLPFPGLHLDQAHTDIRGYLVCRPPIIRSQAGRDPEDGDDLIWTERSHCQREQHGGVDAAGECHA